SAVVATSPWAARRLVAQHGLGAERVHVAAPGADRAPLAPGTDGVTHLLCVGAVTATKGQDLLVEALATVADLPWSCDLVGPLRRAGAARQAERMGGDVPMSGRRAGSAAWGARLSSPGSPVCAPAWLALREGADAAARASELVEPVRVHLAAGAGPGTAAVIRD